MFAGIFERVTADVFRTLARDQRDTLSCDGLTFDIDVVFDAAVQPFGVFPDEYDIDVLKPGLQTFECHGRADIGVKFEFLAQLDVDTAEAATDRCRQRAFEHKAVFSDRLHGFLGNL